jgi:AcrR family transcriptional regulator
VTDLQPPAAEGLRERKRRETAELIKQAAIRLFIAKGYDATTLDDIAAAANISRRTFFHYFKSKDDILLTTQLGMGTAFAEAIRNEPLTDRPIDTVRAAALKVSAPIVTKKVLVIDRLLRSSEAVQARKAAIIIHNEGAVLQALREKWPDPGREPALRMMAVLALGAMRLSLDALHRENGKRSLADHVRDLFDALDAEF